jgi:hypothetical protein
VQAKAIKKAPWLSQGAENLPMGVTHPVRTEQNRDAIGLRPKALPGVLS